jgi:Flp pilus assembly protein TadD
VISSEVIWLLPTDDLAFSNRGTTYYRKQDYGRAIADFNEAIRLNPTNAPSIYNRGLAKQLMGDSTGSRADIAAAKKLNPNVDK